MLIPVIDKGKQPLMPCTPRRARILMRKGEAKAYWQKGIFCIRLLREPSDRNSQTIVLGLDPGSKREGYTVATSKHVVLSITTNTPDWIKSHIETRRNLRRSRRQRKTPYRKCRENRSSLRNSERITPSIKARWDAKLRITKFLLRILPITIINIEDIKAKTRKGEDRRNTSFSPLEVGKKFFEKEIENLNLTLIKTLGTETYKARKIRNFKKSSKKLEYIWETHNVDSHILCEIALDKKLVPYKDLYKIEFLEFHRRQLHIQNPIKGNIRRLYGGTVSSGMSRGSIIRYKEKLYSLGGESKRGISLHDINTGKRVKRSTKIKDIKMLYNSKWRAQFLPNL